jgi:hypothetical protein
LRVEWEAGESWSGNKLKDVNFHSLKLTPLMTAEESEEDLRQRAAFSKRRDEG